ncbi:MAG: ferrochelatase [Deltaproteobacteria bacterium]|nr:ferrochelatase [Deltaproteobacteria bacterium]
MTTGIIMVTLGGPRSQMEIPEFIRRFIGRDLPAPAMKAVIERYELIGGFSPLTSITAEQAQKLNAMLGNDYLCLPAFRYSPPFIEDVMESVTAAGAARILFLLLSPFYASVTTGNYINTAPASRTSSKSKQRWPPSLHKPVSPIMPSAGRAFRITSRKPG